MFELCYLGVPYVKSHYLFVLAMLLLFCCGCGPSVESIQNEVVSIESDWVDGHNANIDAHNRFARIESAFADDFNDAGTLDEQVSVARQAAESLELTRLETATDAYRTSFQQYTDHVKQLIAALNEESDAQVDEQIRAIEETTAKLSKIIGDSQLEAVQEARKRLSALDLSRCPKDYRDAVEAWGENLGEIEASLQQSVDGPAFDNSLLDRQAALMQQVNSAASE